MQGQTRGYVLTTLVTAPILSRMVPLFGWKDDYQIIGESNTPDYSQDAFSLRTIDRCCAAASRYCNRIFGLATWQDEFRPQHGVWGEGTRAQTNPLVLTRWPLVSVTSVVETVNGTSTTLVQGTDFEVDTGSLLPGDEGSARLFRLNEQGNPRTWPAAQIVVIYQAGYVLPVDSWGQGVIYQPSFFVSSNGNIYQTPLGGTSGTTAPSGTGTGTSDGAVVWNYVGSLQTPTLPADLQDAVGRMVYTRYIERKRDPFIRSKAIAAGGTTTYWAGASQAEGNLSADVAEILSAYRVPVVA